MQVTRLHHPQGEKGFSLIELTIALIVIGLIVGGVLVGEDLKRAGEVRAALTQIEKYQSAVGTFRSKYNALPGDMSTWTASTFRFAPRGNCNGHSPCLGEGDGNGVIEGIRTNGEGGDCGICESAGETAMFWVDLSTDNAINVSLIDETFNTATASSMPGFIPTAAVNLYMPRSKLKRGNYIYVYSNNHFNYFGLSAVGSIRAGGTLNSTATLTVSQAYTIDSKIDDGYPQTGTVTAQYAGAENVLWSGAADGVSATPASAATCYDNNNSPGAPQSYSMQIDNGTGVNCALSFRFQ